MRKKIGLCLFLTFLLVMSSCSTKQNESSKLITLPELASKQLKIACVGDSITYGYTIEQRERNSYPAQLQAMINDKVEVKNFGFNGSGVQKSSNLPYWNQEEFQESLRYQPDIVYLMLGTNDAKDINWKNKERFKKDYVALLKEYQKLDSHPIIYLMTPSMAYSLAKDGTLFHGIALDNIKKITSVVKEIAKEEAFEVIDIYKATQEHKENYLVDGVHPDKDGATRIALNAYERYEKNRLLDIINTYQAWFIADVLNM